jgi:amino acid transporter
MTFLGVCGGPYGLEGSVSAGGPALTLLAMVCLPFVWSLGMCLMTAELSTAMPSNMGYILWVERAFGHFPGFLNGMFAMFCNIVDNSLYPALFADYLGYLVGGEIPRTVRALIQIVVVISTLCINVVGMDMVGSASILFSIIITSPFILLVILGLPSVDSQLWLQGPPQESGVQWGTFLAIVLWNTSGWDSIGCIAGEVKDPERTYPLAMLIALAMTSMIYILPLAVAICLNDDYINWSDGYFTIIAHEGIGEWLGLWMMFSGLFSALGMFNVLLATSARAMQGVASLGMAPAFLKLEHPKYATPHMAIYVNCIFIVFINWFLQFGAIVELDSFLYACKLILEFCAFLYLKYSEPNMVRPYQVPYGTTGAWLVSLPPMCLAMTMLFMASSRTIYLASAATLAGTCLYVLINNSENPYVSRILQFCGCQVPYPTGFNNSNNSSSSAPPPPSFIRRMLFGSDMSTRYRPLDSQSSSTELLDQN